MKNISSTYRFICLAFVFVVLLQTGLSVASFDSKKLAKTEQSTDESKTELQAATFEAVIPGINFEFYKIVIPSVFESAIQQTYIFKFKQRITSYLSYFDNLFQSSIQTLAP